MGYFRRNDFPSACSLARRKDSRGLGSTPLLNCPRQLTFPLWLVSNRDGVPFVGPLRPISMLPDAARRKYSSVIAFWRTAFLQKSDFHLIELVVDVDLGDFGRNYQKVCSLVRRKDSRRFGGHGEVFFASFESTNFLVLFLASKSDHSFVNQSLFGL